MVADRNAFPWDFAGCVWRQSWNMLLDAGGASYYEVKFSDATKPNGQIWAGVIGPSGPNAPQGSANQRWFVVWLGTANDPGRGNVNGAKALAESVLPLTAPPPAPAAPASGSSRSGSSTRPGKSSGAPHPPHPPLTLRHHRRHRRAARATGTPDSPPAVTARRPLQARYRPNRPNRL